MDVRAGLQSGRYPIGRGAVLALAVLALALLAGCAGHRGHLPGGSGLVRTFSFSVAGTSYTVYRASRQRNLFKISTDSGGPGKRRQMAKVVRLAYGCHALELTEIKPDWQEAEARGAVCTGGYQRFR